MRLKLSLFVLLHIGVALSACAATPGSAVQSGAGPQTEDQKTLYALGQALGQNVRGAGLSEAELESVLQGLSDAALKRPSKVEMSQYGPKLQAFMSGRMQTAAAGELAASQAFVEEQAKVAGATRTTSG